MNPCLLALVIIVIIIITHYAIGVYTYRRIIQKIPSPPGHWFLGNLDFALTKPQPEDVFLFLRECAAKYWPIYRLSSPLGAFICILHPADFEKILSQPKHMTKSFFYNIMENWLGQGLLTSAGPKWHHRRKLLTGAFHFTILQQYISIFNEETNELVNQIEGATIHDTYGINMLPIISQATLNAMSETSMGIKNINKTTMEKYRNNVHKMGTFVLNKILKPWTQLPIIKWFIGYESNENSTIKELHNFTNNVIMAREKEYLKENISNTSSKKIMKMLDLLLQEKLITGSIDYEGIREEVDTFMFEGHDTTAAAIVYLLYTLSQYEDIQEKVREEIIEVVGSSTAPTYQQLQKLSYAEIVIKEVLRLYPSVPFISRITSEDFVTDSGYLIPSGTIVTLNIFDLHRDPRIYPDPLKFDPNRFLLENSRGRHPFAYLPFSAGPRNCIGQKFAMLEMKAVICGVLRKFTMTSATDSIAFSADLILRTKNDIKIKFSPIQV